MKVDEVVRRRFFDAEVAQRFKSIRNNLHDIDRKTNITNH
ncbi:hypothetical protein HORM4_1060041 [Vibrio harveyi]|nr:hypothetical protein HORM4_1060041 [Vibrio harveyi]